MKKFFLLSGYPPGQGGVAEILLRDLCGMLPPESVRGFAMPPRQYQAKDDPSLAPYRFDRAPCRYEPGWRPLPGALGGITARIGSRVLLPRHAAGLAAQAIGHAKDFQPDAVWVVPDSMSTILIAERVAGALGVPLHTQVWDPPDNLWVRLGLDAGSRAWIRKRFHRLLARSTRVAVVSEPMREAFSKHTGAECTILRHGIEAAMPEHPGCGEDGTLRIGFCGGLYATDAFACLVDALNRLDWTIGDKPVSLRMLGSDLHFKMRQPARIEYLGFRPVDETARCLSECDLNYLPYPFGDAWIETVKYSFPTKLTTYLATGRPVLLHGPDYSSLASFHQQHPVGAFCGSLDPDQLAKQLTGLLDNPEAYAAAGAAAREVMEQHLSRSAMKRDFAHFLDTGEDELRNEH